MVTLTLSSTKVELEIVKNYYKDPFSKSRTTTPSKHVIPSKYGIQCSITLHPPVEPLSSMLMFPIVSSQLNNHIVKHPYPQYGDKDCIFSVGLDAS